jgi:hypothetical protein
MALLIHLILLGYAKTFRARLCTMWAFFDILASYNVISKRAGTNGLATSSAISAYTYFEALDQGIYAVQINSSHWASRTYMTNIVTLAILKWCPAARLFRLQPAGLAGFQALSSLLVPKLLISASYNYQK